MLYKSARRWYNVHMKIKYRKTIISAVVGVLLVGGGFYYAAKKPKTSYVTTTVKSGVLIQTVSETGSVRRASEVDLNFIAQGRIATTTVAVGESVKRGQILAELDNISLKLQAQQAAAGLSVAKANLQKTLNGASIEDIKISQTNIAQAETQLANTKNDYEKLHGLTNESIKQAEKNLSDIENSSALSSPLGQAVKSAQNSLINTKSTYQKTIDNRIASALQGVNDKNNTAKVALDIVNRILTDDDIKDTLGVLDSTLLGLAKNNYDKANLQLDKARSGIIQANKSKSLKDTYSALNDSSILLDLTNSTLSDTFSVLEKTIISSTLNQASLDGFKANISSQLTIIGGAISMIQSLEQSLSDASLTYDTAVSNANTALATAQASYNNGLQTAQNGLSSSKISQTQQLTSAQARIDSANDALKTAKAQYLKLIANTRPEDVAVVMAQVKQAQANLDSANNSVNNGIIKAPFDGLITQANYLVGEEPGPSKPVIVMQGNDSFEIGVDVSESDIAKLAIGNSVEIDFDAFGGDVKFSGELISIEPAQTVIQEVVYYKCTIGRIKPLEGFESYQKILKSGMTANVVILAKKKDNVLIVANRAVIEKADKTRIVRVLRNGSPVEVLIEIGMRGDDGLTEVLNGLSSGEEIVLTINGQ